VSFASLQRCPVMANRLNVSNIFLSFWARLFKSFCLCSRSIETGSSVPITISLPEAVLMWIEPFGA